MRQELSKAKKVNCSHIQLNKSVDLMKQIHYDQSLSIPCRAFSRNELRSDIKPEMLV